MHPTGALPDSFVMRSPGSTFGALTRSLVLICLEGHDPSRGAMAGPAEPRRFPRDSET